MKKNAGILFVVALTLLVSHTNKNKTFDENTAPTKNEAKYLITETLKGISEYPSSVNIDYIGAILWHRDFGWIVPCNFTMKNRFGRQERKLLYFSIIGNAISGIGILTSEQTASLKHLPMDTIHNRYIIDI